MGIDWSPDFKAEKPKTMIGDVLPKCSKCGGFRITTCKPCVRASLLAEIHAAVDDALREGVAERLNSILALFSPGGRFGPGEGE